MAMVITVAQQKGGAGKTTLAANLAAYFAADARVALIDIDPQHSLSRWHGLRPKRRAPMTLLEVSFWRLAAELDRLRRTVDFVLIDSPPQIETDARTAIRAADLVLVPVQPSPVDVWATAGTLRLATAEKRRAVLVLNRVPASSRLTGTVEATCRTEGYTLLSARLGNRTAFASAFAVGLGVTEVAPNSPAAAELGALGREIRGMFT